MASNESLRKLLGHTLNQDIQILPFHEAIKEAKHMKTGNALVMNSAAEFIKEGHFLVLIKYDNDQILVFDPLASKYTDFLLQPLFKNFHTLFINKVQVQNNESEFCSLFCASFLIAFFKHKNIENYFNHFSKKLKINDLYVIEYIFNELQNIT